LLTGGKVLVAGGWDNQGNTLASAELYDPASGIWTSAGSLNTARSNPTATLLPNGQVLVAGGVRDDGLIGYLLASAELYNPARGTWTVTGSLNTARLYHTATLLPNGQVLVAGGIGNGITPLASAELYNPATGVWTVTGPLNTARYLHTATLLPNGQVLVAGGVDANNNPLASAELYNPATGQWTAISPMNSPRDNHTATLLPNGLVLVAGGAALASAELYNPALGTWTLTSPMAYNRVAHTATLLPNGMVLVAGGGYWNGTTEIYLTAAELYNPVNGTWTQTGSLNTGRSFHSATLLPSGQVLVAGGQWAEGFNYLSSAELYNPALGTWTFTGSMNDIRYGLTATLLLNGQVLAAGGFSPGYSAELYEPALGTWTVTGTMNTQPDWHTATLLPNGQVLVAGGADWSGAISAAELYTIGLGFNASWQPQIAYFTSLLGLNQSLGLIGSQFQGVSEGSGGNGGQNSPANYPLVQVYSLVNQQTVFVPVAYWSANSFASAPVTGLPPGYALVTVFVNGIPSTFGNALVPHVADGRPITLGGDAPVPAINTGVPSTSGIINITALPPTLVASFTASTNSGTAPLTVAFTDTSSGSPTGWYWTDNIGDTSTSENPSFTYTTPGTYTVMLIASNGGGTSSPFMKTITVLPPPAPPVAGFTANTFSGAAPLTVTFTDTSSGSPTTWYWTYGDGGSSTNLTELNPSYTYLTPGAWTVSLIASNAGGASSPVTQTINVYSPYNWWRNSYFQGTNTANGAPGADYTGTGMSNTNKFLAGFSPISAAAYLRIISITTSNTNVIVTFLGANGDNTYIPGIASRTNVLEYATAATDGSYVNNFTNPPVQSIILSGGSGLGTVTNLTDAGGTTNGPSRFYRVRVLLP
jgi:PKD repeat protein